MNKSKKNIDSGPTEQRTIDKKSAEVHYKVWTRAKKFYDLYAVRHKGKLGILFFGAVLAGILEVFGILLLYLLLSVMISGEINTGIEKIFQNIFISLGLTTKISFVIGMGSLITLIFILKNVYIVFYYHYQHSILKEWKLDVSSMFMQKYLHASYSFLIEYNSTTIIRNINSVVGSALNGFVLSVFNFSANIIVCAIILGVLYAKFLAATLLIFGVLLACTFIQNAFLKKKLREIGQRKEMIDSYSAKHVNQGIHALKETKVIGRENYFFEAFNTIHRKSIDNNMRAQLLSRIPSHITEVMIILAIVAFSAAVLIEYEQDAVSSISFLGVLAAVAFRIAPLVNRTLIAMQGMQKNMSSMDTMFRELQKLDDFKVYTKDREEIEPLCFEKSIVFEDVTFRYPNVGSDTIKGISFRVKRGEIVGIVGESGAGKTTVTDLLLGLIQPLEGSIFIDNEKLLTSNAKNWQRNLGYVPQSVYLHDASIANNIAFGLPSHKIDREKICAVLKEVQLDSYVSNLDEGIDFVIGENGKKLSGGQRQRLGIARALYLDSSVLIFDEATAALDVPTEHQITDNFKLFRGKKTVFIVAHRLSTILCADMIIFMNDGSIDGIGTYAELFSSNKKFEHMARMAKVLPDN